MIDSEEKLLHAIQRHYAKTMITCKAVCVVHDVDGVAIVGDVVFMSDRVANLLPSFLRFPTDGMKVYYCRYSLADALGILAKKEVIL